jgi:hypothetical protein
MQNLHVQRNVFFEQINFLCIEALHDLAHNLEVFLSKRYFLCLICVINATIFSCTHYIFKVHSEKDEKSTFSLL